MSILTSYKKVWKIIDSGSKGSLYFLLPLPILSSLIELGTAILVFNLVFFVLQSPESAPSISVFDDYSWLAWIRAQGSVFAISAVAVAAAVKAVYRLTNLYVSSYIVEKTIGVAKKKLFKQYLFAPLLFHTSGNSSDLVRNLWTQVEHMIRGSISTAQGFASNIFSISALMLPIVVVSPKSLLVLLATIALFAGLALNVTKKYQYRWGAAWHQVISSMLAIIKQSLEGIREIKVYQKEPHFLKKYEKAEKTFERLRRWQSLVDTAPGVVLEGFLMIGLSVVLLWLTSRNLDLAAMGPVLGLIAYASIRIMPLSNELIIQISRLRRMEATIDSVASDYEKTHIHRVVSSDELSTGSRTTPRSTKVGETTQGEFKPASLVFKDVTFHYPSERSAGVNSLSFKIKPGTSVAIVGPTGAGKSTLLNMILGFLRPDEGAISINGENLTEHLDNWLPRIGYVPQEPFILDGTILDNIAFAVDEADIDPDLLKHVVRAAQIEGWVSGLPEGLGTAVGESGVRISGGQRQRIAIARALFRRPSVLIMDEPTSAIDTRTERALERAILSSGTEITRILVTHRLDTARLCDSVLFLENGRLMGVGPFAQLCDENPSFGSFVSSDALHENSSSDSSS